MSFASLRRTPIRWLLVSLVGGYISKFVIWLVDNVAGNWATDRLDQVMTQWGGAAAIIAKVITWAADHPVGATVIIGTAIVVLLQAHAHAWWRGSAVIVTMNPYRVGHSADGKHFIVFPDVTITNRHTEPESIQVHLLMDERLPQYDYTHKHAAKPELQPVPGWEQSSWFKRNSPIQFPLNIDGKRAVHGYIAFCVWSGSHVPESRNKTRLQFTDLSERTVFEADQSGMTMLGGFSDQSARVKLPPAEPIAQLASGVTATGGEWEQEAKRRLLQTADAKKTVGRVGLEIQAARFGLPAPDGRWDEVTIAVRRLIDRGHIDIGRWNNKTLDCVGDKDPAPGKRKRLEVTYTVNGELRPVATFREKEDPLRLP